MFRTQCILHCLWACTVYNKNIIRLENRCSLVIFDFEPDVHKVSSGFFYVLVDVFEEAAEEVQFGAGQELAEDVAILEYKSGLDHFESPDTFSASLGIFIAVVHHRNENVEKNNGRKADIEREDDPEKSHTIVQLLLTLIEKRANAERRDEHVVNCHIKPNRIY